MNRCVLSLRVLCKGCTVEVCTVEVVIYLRSIFIFYLLGLRFALLIQIIPTRITPDERGFAM
jgi:hypothetical protein